jgi:hypothetical protein
MLTLKKTNPALGGAGKGSLVVLRNGGSAFKLQDTTDPQTVQ